MVKLFVEGGGDSKSLKTECRRSFTCFITKAGITQKPRIVACGSRWNAYDSFCTEIANGGAALLLVDSEAPVDIEYRRQVDSTSWRPWQYLHASDGDRWTKPDAARDCDCHLMVQCMESWFMADQKTLTEFFGQEFMGNQLPNAQNDIEIFHKNQIFIALVNATRHCKKGPYGKASHSFELLSRLDPALVLTASPWAKRLVDELKNR